MLPVVALVALVHATAGPAESESPISAARVGGVSALVVGAVGTVVCGVSAASMELELEQRLAAAKAKTAVIDARGFRQNESTEVLLLVGTGVAVAVSVAGGVLLAQ